MTILQIAKELKLSTATVSYALKSDPRVAEPTRSLVLDYAGKIGYRVNEQARNLRLGRSGVVALVVHGIASEFWAGVASSIEKSLGSSFNLLLCNTEGSLEKENAILDGLTARKIDGLIIQPADNLHTERLSALGRSGLPVVLFDRVADERVSFVKGDDYSSAKRAVELFAKAGRKRIAFLSQQLEPHNFGGLDRAAGFDDAVADLGLKGCEKIILPGSEEKIAEAFVGRAGSFDAVISSIARLGLRLQFALRRGGVRVPDDLATMTWDNFSYMDYLEPPLSCVAVPVAEMGARGAAIIKAFHEGEKAPVRIFLEEPFIFRESFNPYS